MCPATIAIIGAVGVGLGAVGAIGGGIAQANAASYQGKVAANNATIAQNNARYSASATATDTEQASLKARRMRPQSSSTNQAHQLFNTVPCHRLVLSTQRYLQGAFWHHAERSISTSAPAIESDPYMGQTACTIGLSLSNPRIKNTQF